MLLVAVMLKALWSEIHLHILPGNLSEMAKDEELKAERTSLSFLVMEFTVRGGKKKSRRERSNASCCCNFTNLWQALKCQKFTPKGVIHHVTTANGDYCTVWCTCTTKTSCLEKQCFAKNSEIIWLNNILSAISLSQLVSNKELKWEHENVMERRNSSWRRGEANWEKKEKAFHYHLQRRKYLNWEEDW